MVVILQTTNWNAFSWMGIAVFILIFLLHLDVLVQERRNPIANALEFTSFLHSPVDLSLYMGPINNKSTLVPGNGLVQSRRHISTWTNYDPVHWRIYVSTDPSISSNKPVVGIRDVPSQPVSLRWRHQMEIFCALLTIYAGNSLVTGEFPAQRPMTRSFDVFFDLRQNKQLSKQWWGWWFEAPLHQLLRHCNDVWMRCNWLMPSTSTSCS